MYKIYLTPKQIKDKSNFKLTNADISANYLNDKFHLMLNDFKGAFVCCRIALLKKKLCRLIIH